MACGYFDQAHFNHEFGRWPEWLPVSFSPFQRRLLTRPIFTISDLYSVYHRNQSNRRFLP